MVTVLTGMPGANPSSTFALSQKEKKKKGELPLGQRTRAELIQTSRPAYLLINEHKQRGVAVRAVAPLTPGSGSPDGMMMRVYSELRLTSRSGSTGVDEGGACVCVRLSEGGQEESSG